LRIEERRMAQGTGRKERDKRSDQVVATAGKADL
jgi:hypothetical protein